MGVHEDDGVEVVDRVMEARRIMGVLGLKLRERSIECRAEARFIMTRTLQRRVYGRRVTPINVVAIQTRASDWHEHPRVYSLTTVF